MLSDPLFALLFVPVFFIKFVHAISINNKQDYEADDGSLLCHPKAEWCTPNRKLIKLVFKKNPASKGHDKPNAKKFGYKIEAFLPVAGGLRNGIIFHGLYLNLTISSGIRCTRK